MKTRNRLRLSLLAGIIASLCAPVVLSQSDFKGCQAEGTAKRQSVRDLNTLKNRDDAPGNIDESITLAKILRKGNDRERWSSDKGVEITGYVASVSPGGYKESCNCGRKDLQDIHINVVTSPRWRNNEQSILLLRSLHAGKRNSASRSRASKHR